MTKKTTSKLTKENKAWIIAETKEKIEANKKDWAKNYISMKANENLDTAEGRKNVDSAKFNLDEIAKRLEWLEKFLKSPELA